MLQVIGNLAIEASGRRIVLAHDDVMQQLLLLLCADTHQARLRYLLRYLLLYYCFTTALLGATDCAGKR